MVSPRKNETIATSGTEPTPARSVWRKKLAARKRTRGRAACCRSCQLTCLDDEPEHAADLAEESAAFADSLDDHDRVGLERDECFAVPVLGSRP